MSRKIKDLKKGDAILFQKQDDEISYFGRVIDIFNAQTIGVVKTETSLMTIDNSYKIFKVY
ncbi:hypothetical protein BU107_10625 [Staphylococcus xylosus]|uniref:hypothetical protein n=1 Tax=Staphylococcus xylosus TaxID=1288 RepID=UPI000E6A09EE|nr:hypothetical protein [Staphylococcus xylosus]RIM86004.1 hypothetical protein BU107_10625 [Staphylococcus xylosus]